jgi:hypothetical protein
MAVDPSAEFGYDLLALALSFFKRFSPLLRTFLWAICYAYKLQHKISFSTMGHSAKLMTRMQNRTTSFKS